MERTVTINNNLYAIPEMDFEAVCELEEHGVDLLAMDSQHPKLASTLRGICAWVMGVDNKRASHELSEHIRNGGDLIVILEAVTAALGDSGFFGGNRTEKAMPTPQDHRKKENNKNNTAGSQTS